MKKYIILVISLISFSMNAQLKSVAYTDGGQKLEGFFAKATVANPKNIGVIILPAWMGIDAHAKESAENLAALGYHAFVADIYGVGNTPSNTTEAGKLAGYFKNNYKDYQKRIQLAIDQLVKQGANPDEIAVIGYCFGGTGALEAARGNLKVKGVVSFHGGLGKDPMRQTEVITPKILVLHGADDPYVPQKEVLAFQDEMKIGKAVWQMNMYSNAVHAFTHKDLDTDNSKGAAYNELADKRSWQAMKDFFTEIFN
ncbi:MAG: dienelactone hydrolase [Flavobacterium sp.]|uniref:dienelactone hydrolase family protein n=1 Tax=unclassified Flavobacterium TaxID=196869 RepID=UPI000C59402B|nr:MULTISPECIES: dienelactone hydrolase family protein [unclassified Flavobacterium]MBF04527.1 dienelactone hydrolase [Flavobacterium sp.]MCO6164080.1 dienelactone hydrolase family protein [Flavobacterium sp. NRK F7]